MPHQTQETDYIIIAGLEGNNPTQLTAYQELMVPHTSALFLFWWLLWLTVGIYLLGKYIVMRLIKRNE